MGRHHRHTDTAPDHAGDPQGGLAGVIPTPRAPCNATDSAPATPEHVEGTEARGWRAWRSRRAALKQANARAAQIARAQRRARQVALASQPEPPSSR
jgi:hypothetical protein